MIYQQLNLVSHKNVSIKCTKVNTIYCADVFNFLYSSSLELIVIQYTLPMIIKNYYLFDLEDFFIKLKASLDLNLLSALKLYVKKLHYPFTAYQRKKCCKMSKLILKHDFCGFRVNCKLSLKNKRIQCSLKLDKLMVKIDYRRLCSKTLL